MEKNKTFNTGDKVQIIRYGCLACEVKGDINPLPFPLYKEDDNYRFVDVNPDIVGERAIIVNGDDSGYTIETKNGEIAWFTISQLKLINKNPNTL